MGLSVLQAGCLGDVLADGQIAATRKAAVAVNTIADFELQAAAMEGGIAQFEGMHLLRPDNTDALFLLTQAWGGYAYAIVQDAYEEATDRGDDELATYHKKRARLAYDRAVFYGLELLGHRASGFEAARRNANTLDKWLDEHFVKSDNYTEKEDAQDLFWTGYAWLSRVDLYKDDTAMVADLFVGVSMMERSVALDPTVEHWSGTVALAAYHARPGGEMDQAHDLFEKALAKSERKNLQVQLNYATSYACLKGDRTLYETMLNEVLSSTDPDPEQRLSNLLAKRRARRALSRQHMLDCGFDMSSHAAHTGPAPATPPTTKH